MKLTRIFQALVSTVFVVASSLQTNAEVKEVHIKGDHKTIQLSPNGLWVQDLGTEESHNTLVNRVHSLNLHFDKPTTSNPYSIDCEKSYGEMDFSEYNVCQYVIVDVESMGDNKYRIKSKCNRDEVTNIETDILTFDPLTNTISLNDGQPFWSIGSESYPDGILAEITGDNVNFRSGPGTNYPYAEFPYYRYSSYNGEKYPGGCARFAGNRGERVIICPEFENPEWYRIAVPSVSNEAFNYVWVSKKYCKPIMSEGLKHKNPKEIYVLADNEEPEDDELGCWQPSIQIIFVFDNYVCCKIDSYQNSVSWGYYYPDQYLNFFMTTNANFINERQTGLSVNVGEDVVTFDLSKGCSIASVGIPEAKEWGYLPLMSVFEGTQIKKMMDDVLKKNKLQSTFDIVLKEDLDRYKYYSFDFEE